MISLALIWSRVRFPTKEPKSIAGTPTANEIHTGTVINPAAAFILIAITPESTKYAEMVAIYSSVLSSDCIK